LNLEGSSYWQTTAVWAMRAFQVSGAQHSEVRGKQT